MSIGSIGFERVEKWRALAIFDRLRDVYRRRKVAQETRAALEALDDAALRDLGLSRCLIPWLAEEAARKSG